MCRMARFAGSFPFVLVLLGSCGAVAPVPVTAPDAAVAVAAPPAAQAPKDDKDGAKDKAAKEKADAKKQKQKDLRHKQRDLLVARAEHVIAALDRQVRQWGVERTLRKTADELEQHQRDKAVFLRDVKPREIEEHKISLDRSIHRAEHAKDEFDELQAMYAADEFAKTTKELVLKRGRREMELAQRSLAVEQKEHAHFEQVELPKRERDLQQKVDEAAAEHRKADAEASKWKLEVELALQKEAHRIADLDQEILELEQTLAKDAP